MGVWQVGQLALPSAAALDCPIVRICSAPTPAPAAACVIAGAGEVATSATWQRGQRNVPAAPSGTRTFAPH
jgi:hypothetical protein